MKSNLVIPGLAFVAGLGIGLKGGIELLSAQFERYINSDEYREELSKAYKERIEKYFQKD